MLDHVPELKGGPPEDLLRQLWAIVTFKLPVEELLHLAGPGRHLGRWQRLRGLSLSELKHDFSLLILLEFRGLAQAHLLLAQCRLRAGLYRILKLIQRDLV